MSKNKKRSVFDESVVVKRWCRMALAHVRAGVERDERENDPRRRGYDRHTLYMVHMTSLVTTMAGLSAEESDAEQDFKFPGLREVIYPPEGGK